MREFEEKSAPLWAKRGLSLGVVLLFVAGLLLGLLLRETMLGVLIFAFGAIFVAIRGYLNTGDRAITGALIFVVLVATGIEAIVYFLGP